MAAERFVIELFYAFVCVQPADPWKFKEKPDSQLSLLKVLFRQLRTPFLSVVCPRMFLAIFRCSQPIIIHETIQLISESRDNTVSPYDGFWILLAAITVYLGLPVR